ncbi:hypothetical protein ASPWEDRAFT_173574 [Aspergillus wentii DTO 134E9]|uniref:Uncharacterized protein n=1 Tax=Aspergillus wentii DTO 134E9 TaxID=1073089 RepID=A0A1L9RH06_ASPWE|nr:uncharacterized protein ASPWEDRAFT_173574 [Aspergillus wentii DTO 134E9]OJJ34148.1 hypothetical protein ASPWEDRAFT_173574 [Aspergillus wentii DTO 134E9]
MDSPRTPFLVKSGPHFEPVDEEPLEKPPESIIRSSTRHPPSKYYIALCIRIFIVLLAIWDCVALVLLLIQHFRPSVLTPRFPDVYRPSTLPPTLNFCDCGSSISEAISKSCTFDILATSWLPPYCRDEELTAEFERSGPGPNGAWSYFADEAATIPMNKSQIAALADVNGTFWVTQAWHLEHCIFYWMKYVRMRDTGAVMEDRFEGVDHVRHCGLLFRDEKDNLSTMMIEASVVLQSGK